MTRNDDPIALFSGVVLVIIALGLILVNWSAGTGPFSTNWTSILGFFGAFISVIFAFGIVVWGMKK